MPVVGLQRRADSSRYRRATEEVGFISSSGGAVGGGGAWVPARVPGAGCWCWRWYWCRGTGIGAGIGILVLCLLVLLLGGGLLSLAGGGSERTRYISLLSL